MASPAAALLEKTTDANILREVIGVAAQRQMKLGIESRTGAATGERSYGRLAQRNGYCDRDWERAGTADSQTSHGQLLPRLCRTVPRHEDVYTCRCIVIKLYMYHFNFLNIRSL